MDIEAADVLKVLEQLFPKELQIAILTVQNQQLQRRLAIATAEPTSPIEVEAETP